MTQPAPLDHFYLDQWLVQAPLHQLSSAKNVVQVESKVMEVLVYLALHAGQTISRDELLTEVWPDVVVSDDALTHTISKLRRALGDTPRQPRFIQTIPKRGYCLVAPVRPVYEGDALPTPVFTPEAPPIQAEAYRNRSPWAGLLSLLLIVVAAGIAFLLWSTSPVTPLQPVPVTSADGRELHPALSPNAEHVAFAWAGERGNLDIYVQAIGQAAPMQLTDHPAMDLRPVWSPDGQRLAFLRYTEETCSIYEKPLIGGVERRITDCGTNPTADLAWSPDGRWLIFADRPTPEGPSYLVGYDIRSGTSRPLTAPQLGLTGDHAPSIAPDGRRLAFTRTRGAGNEDLFVGALDGGVPQQLTSDQRMIWGHTWSADGQRLIFSSNRAGLFNLWQIPVSGGEPTWIAAAGAATVRDPSMVGHRLIYERWDYDADIWHRALQSPDAEPERFIASTQWESSPRWSPDGQHVAFVSRRSGHLELWVSQADGSAPRQVTSFKGAYVSDPYWSPDGEHLAFIARPDIRSDLFTVHLATQHLRRLTTDPYEEAAPSWSSDGQHIFFGSNRSGTWEIWSLPANGGDATQVTQHGGHTSHVTPDDEFLYYTKKNQPALWRRALQGGSEEHVLEDLAPDDWFFVGDTLFYLHANEPIVIRYDLATGRSSEVMHFPSRPLRASLTLAPNASYMLYAQMDRSESDLMLIEAVQ